MESKYLFVYGTLKRDSGHPMHTKMTQYASYYCNAWIQGELVDLGGYPGLVQGKDTDKNTYGEVYNINNMKALFELLDDYEECSDQFPEPHEYIRLQKNVVTDKNSTVKAWVYLYNIIFNKS